MLDLYLSTFERCFPNKSLHLLFLIYLHFFDSHSCFWPIGGSREGNFLLICSQGQDSSVSFFLLTCFDFFSSVEPEGEYEWFIKMLINANVSKENCHLRLCTSMSEVFSQRIISNEHFIQVHTFFSFNTISPMLIIMFLTES